MSKESQVASPPTDFIFANLLAESAWSKSYDFSALYTWTTQQANDATARGRGHDSECHKKAAELEILAKSMREHCANTKRAYAKIEGYEILLANVALEMHKREREWAKMEEGYKAKVATLDIQINELKSTIETHETTIRQATETKEDWYKKLRAAVALLLNSYPEDVVASTTTVGTTTSTTSTVSTSEKRNVRINASSASITAGSISSSAGAISGSTSSSAGVLAGSTGNSAGVIAGSAGVIAGSTGTTATIAGP